MSFYCAAPIQLLQDLCQKNNWGSPVYQLHSAIQKDAFRDASAQFFLYKVSIPALPNHVITPNKLCRTLEEARIFAAEYTLKFLGIPVESSEISGPQPATATPAAYHPQARPLAPAISIAREVQVPMSYAASYVIPSADYGRY
ncbi:Apobec1 complementation factor [Plakobranchus ocellatus]|uniref:Apobec1 complementation factor n=1 Tax=Plakobranchus ocellatus TaxID=259542 RepID=A0AAV3Y8I7_9GAST|nr:Apobec1 complementation factor [Plakobranchus ocellatus]